MIHNRPSLQKLMMIKNINSHACSEHKGKACYVRNDGSHYQYMFLDLSIWAMLLVCLLSFSADSLSLNLDEAETSRYNHPPS
jgi:hypothetical protein